MNIMMAISAFSYVLKHFSQNNCEIAWRYKYYLYFCTRKSTHLCSRQMNGNGETIKETTFTT